MDSQDLSAPFHNESKHFPQVIPETSILSQPGYSQPSDGINPHTIANTSYTHIGCDTLHNITPSDIPLPISSPLVHLILSKLDIQQLTCILLGEIPQDLPISPLDIHPIREFGTGYLFGRAGGTFPSFDHIHAPLSSQSSSPLVSEIKSSHSAPSSTALVKQNSAAHSSPGNSSPSVIIPASPTPSLRPQITFLQRESEDSLLGDHPTSSHEGRLTESTTAAVCSDPLPTATEAIPPHQQTSPHTFPLVSSSQTSHRSYAATPSLQSFTSRIHSDHLAYLTPFSKRKPRILSGTSLVYLIADANDVFWVYKPSIGEQFYPQLPQNSLTHQSHDHQQKIDETNSTQQQQPWLPLLHSSLPPLNVITPVSKYPSIDSFRSNIPLLSHHSSHQHSIVPLRSNHPVNFEPSETHDQIASVKSSIVYHLADIIHRNFELASRQSHPYETLASTASQPRSQAQYSTHHSNVVVPFTNANDDTKCDEPHEYAAGEFHPSNKSYPLPSRAPQLYHGDFPSADSQPQPDLIYPLTLLHPSGLASTTDNDLSSRSTSQHDSLWPTNDIPIQPSSQSVIPLDTPLISSLDPLAAPANPPVEDVNHPNLSLQQPHWDHHQQQPRYEQQPNQWIPLSFSTQTADAPMIHQGAPVRPQLHRPTSSSIVPSIRSQPPSSPFSTSSMTGRLRPQPHYSPSAASESTPTMAGLPPPHIEFSSRAYHGMRALSTICPPRLDRILSAFENEASDSSDTNDAGRNDDDDDDDDDDGNSNIITPTDELASSEQQSTLYHTRPAPSSQGGDYAMSVQDLLSPPPQLPWSSDTLANQPYDRCSTDVHSADGHEDEGSSDPDRTSSSSSHAMSLHHQRSARYSPSVQVDHPPPLSLSHMSARRGSVSEFSYTQLSSRSSIATEISSSPFFVDRQEKSSSYAASHYRAEIVDALDLGVLSTSLPSDETMSTVSVHSSHSASTRSIHVVGHHTHPQQQASQLSTASIECSEPNVEGKSTQIETYTHTSTHSTCTQTDFHQISSQGAIHTTIHMGIGHSQTSTIMTIHEGQPHNYNSHLSSFADINHKDTNQSSEKSLPPHGFPAGVPPSRPSSRSFSHTTSMLSNSTPNLAQYMRPPSHCSPEPRYNPPMSEGRDHDSAPDPLTAASTKLGLNTMMGHHHHHHHATLPPGTTVIPARSDLAPSPRKMIQIHGGHAANYDQGVSHLNHPEAPIESSTYHHAQPVTFPTHTGDAQPPTTYQRLPIRDGVSYGMSLTKELAAHLIDPDLVPETIGLITMTNDPLTGHKDYIMGSLQLYKPSKGSIEDCSPSSICIESIHRVFILDIRLLNLDRHTNNILAVANSQNDVSAVIQERPVVDALGGENNNDDDDECDYDMYAIPSIPTGDRSHTKPSFMQYFHHICHHHGRPNRSSDHHDGDSPQIRTQPACCRRFLALPIDHSLSLPSITNLSDIRFEWVGSANAKRPMSQETLDFIKSIHIPRDSTTLFMVHIPIDSILSNLISTLVLQYCALHLPTLSLDDIGHLFIREEFYNDDFDDDDATDNFVSRPNPSIFELSIHDAFEKTSGYYEQVCCAYPHLELNHRAEIWLHCFLECVLNYIHSHFTTSFQQDTSSIT